MIIREPNDEEILKSLKVLYSAFGRVPPAYIKKEEKLWKTLIELEIGVFLISEKNGKIFGVGGVFLFEKVSSFGYMAVLPEYRGKGIGTEIFKGLLDIADKMNCETKILYASQLGEPIYKKFGFKRRFYGEMYQLPLQTPDLGFINKEINIQNKVPDWLSTLDKKTMGFDRTIYLNTRIGLGAKLLTLENEGYGLIANKRLGPLIATNYKVASQIINKSIKMGANHMIIARHQNFPKKIFELFNLTEMENRASVKMVIGKEIKEKLDLLYAIGTFAKG